MRAITFPKTDEGVWTNGETGVRIVRRHVTTGGGFNIYRPTIDTARGEVLLDRRPTLAEARAVAKERVLDLRNEVAAAYVEAVDEHVERAAAHHGETGVCVGRINMARRAVAYARSDGSGAWLASALLDVRRIDEAREATLVEATSTNAGDSTARGTTGQARAITFPRTGDGVWTNRETGVRIFRTQRGNYLIERPFLGATVDGVMWRQGNGGWLLVSNDACAVLKQAREIAGREAEKMRDRIAAAYTQACLEDSDREGDRLMAAREAANRTAGDMTYPSDAKAYDGKGGVIEPTVHFDPSFGEPMRTVDARDARAITFPKVGYGAWINRETGVRLTRTPECTYLAEWPFLESNSDVPAGYRGNGGWQLIGAHTTLGGALELARFGVERMRGSIAEAYIEAVEEYVERVAQRLTAAGMRAARLDMARFAVARAARGPADDRPWLAVALRDARLAEELILGEGPRDTSPSMNLWRSITGE